MIETTRNKFKANTIGSMLDQLVVILCGLIIPRLILTSFGSEVNGLVNSITQFLGLITFLELGTGAVVKSALYKPLAENNIESISKIVRVAKRFFNILGGILAVYVVILIFVFPHINQSNFSFAFTALLIGAISIGSFAQYFFGIVDTSIITANQRGYLYYFVNIFCLVLNVVSVYFLIKFEYSIQIVKFVSSIIFLIRPIVLHIYTRRHFKIDKNIEYDNSVIPQRWNGVAQHIAAIVLENTDVIVLTIFSTYTDVSIYSVYYLVIKGIQLLIYSTAKGVEPLMGNYIAVRDESRIKSTFSNMEWATHLIAVFLYGCTLILLVPFVRVYTQNITDANYIRPTFSVLISIAYLMRGLRLTYHSTVLAAGKFKETQPIYIVTAAINIFLSVIFVKWLGLVGVAIGTLVAMTIQIFWEANYVSKNITRISFSYTIRQLCVDAITFVIGILATVFIPFWRQDYLGWMLMALCVSSAWGIIVVTINLVFYKEKAINFIKKIHFIKRK